MRVGSEIDIILCNKEIVLEERNAECDLHCESKCWIQNLALEAERLISFLLTQKPGSIRHLFAKNTKASMRNKESNNRVNEQRR